MRRLYISTQPHRWPSRTSNYGTRTPGNSKVKSPLSHLSTFRRGGDCLGRASESVYIYFFRSSLFVFSLVSPFAHGRGGVRRLWNGELIGCVNVMKEKARRRKGMMEGREVRLGGRAREGRFDVEPSIMTFCVQLTAQHILGVICWGTNIDSGISVSFGPSVAAASAGVVPRVAFYPATWKRGWLWPWHGSLFVGRIRKREMP
ncbi:hypothetical protein VTK56DRAFT_6852 [Thermocarpiscus australiensis]